MGCTCSCTKSRISDAHRRMWDVASPSPHRVTRTLQCVCVGVLEGGSWCLVCAARRANFQRAAAKFIHNVTSLRQFQGEKGASLTVLAFQRIFAHGNCYHLFYGTYQSTSNSSALLLPPVDVAVLTIFLLLFDICHSGEYDNMDYGLWTCSIWRHSFFKCRRSTSLMIMYSPKLGIPTLSSAVAWSAWWQLLQMQSCVHNVLFFWMFLRRSACIRFIKGTSCWWCQKML